MVAVNAFGVAILSDDLSTGLEMADYLATNGFVSDAHASTEALLSRMAQDCPALVLMDCNGGLTGRAVGIVQDIHALSPIPCILRASLQTTDSQRVHGLENGVDDWIPAGTAKREVLARIRAVLRRSAKPVGAQPRIGFGQPPIPVPPGTWRISPERRELYAPGGQACGLTSAEFDLIYKLAQNRLTAVGREALSQAVFRRAWYPDDRSIDNLMVRLKRKLAPHIQAREIIKPVRGVGYVFIGF